jgi:DNA polymerase III epsilon subunit family exonuclease
MGDAVTHRSDPHTGRRRSAAPYTLVFTISAVSPVDDSRWARWIGLAAHRAARARGEGLARRRSRRTRAAKSARSSAGTTSPGATSARSRSAGTRSPGGPSDRELADADVPLFEVCFAVVDVETTGGSPSNAALTEVGAVKYRGGECVGSFQTLVDPRCAVPPLISLLTGITDGMVSDAPPVAGVLPSFLEFVRGAVIVGHNICFDLSFLDAALVECGYEPLANTTIDTLVLARRLLGGEVPNHRLHTLGAVLGLEHQASHRALDDARATADLLHLLIERATGYGVLVLGDLVDLMHRPDLRAARVS